MTGTPVTSEQFENHMMRLAVNAGPFRPTAYYDRDGDCIEFLAQPDSFYAERVDDLVTVYRSQENNEVIGALIKDVAKLTADLAKNYPGFPTDMRRVKLEHVFLARLWSTKPDGTGAANRTYGRLAEIADNTDVETELSIA